MVVSVTTLDMAEEQTKLLYEIHSKVLVLDERSQHILTQSTKTNGRVNKLEEDLNTLKQDKASAKGWAAGISVAIGTAWTAINFIFK